MPNNAQYISDTFPTSGKPGAIVPVTVTFKNTGTSTWSSVGRNAYRLGFQDVQDNSNFTPGKNRIELPGPVSPGALVTFAFNIIIPTKALDLRVRMVQEFIMWFGDYSPVHIVNVPDASLIDLLQYFTAIPANGNKSHAGDRTVTLQHINKDVTIFEIVADSPRNWCYFRYIDSEKMIYGMGNTGDFSTFADVYVNEGRAQDQGCKWCPRYMKVGESVVYRNFTIYHYREDTHVLAQVNSAPQVGFTLDWAGKMNIGGDFGLTDVIRIIWGPPGLYPEINYYALGWGRVGWGQYKPDGKTCIMPPEGQSWWTKICSGNILPDLSIWPTKISGLPPKANGGQVMSVDPRC